MDGSFLTNLEQREAEKPLRLIILLTSNTYNLTNFFYHFNRAAASANTEQGANQGPKFNSLLPVLSKTRFVLQSGFNIMALIFVKDTFKR